MLRSHAKTFETLIRALDSVAVFTIALVIGFSMPVQRAGGRAGLLDLVLDAAMAAVLWALVAGRLSIYRSRRSERFVLEVVGLLETTLATFGLTVLIGSGLRGGLQFPPVWAAGIAFPMLVAQRALLRAVLTEVRRRGWNTRKLILVGGGRGARMLVDRVKDNDGFGIKISGWLGTPHPEVADLSDVEHLGSIEDLQRVLAEQCPDSVVLCPPPTAKYVEVEKVFRICSEAGVGCHYAPDHLSPRNLVPAVHWIDDMPVFAFRPQQGTRWQLAVKRVMDFTIAGAALLALLPVFIAVAIAIKMGDGGPILFTQKRVGRRGRVFPCFKFRTMCVDAEAKLATVASLNEVDGPVFKVKSDPRITSVGRFLRKYSLDELPQILNVLRGEMSIVGPRPPLPSEVEKYAWWHRRRISVRPGLTCIWQVWGRNQVGFERWMEMDMEYIDNWTLWMDCKIILHTFTAVFRGTGQ